MSDHGAGPRSIANPEIDITDVYAFPSPEREGHLVAVMDVFPFAAPSALFSDAIDYRIRMRPLRAVSTGPQTAFAVGEEERAFSFTFSVPRALDGGDRLVQEGTCRGPSGDLSFRVGDEGGAPSNGLRVFAGCRQDPFFIDQKFTGGIRINRRLPGQVTGVNFLAGQNVLSIVLELDYSAFFGGETGSLVAVLAETTTNGSFRARLDRVGRPEIKNFILMDKVCDTVNRDLDVRDLYSEEDGFKLRRDYLGAIVPDSMQAWRFMMGLTARRTGRLAIRATTRWQSCCSPISWWLTSRSRSPRTVTSKSSGRCCAASPIRRAAVDG